MKVSTSAIRTGRPATLTLIATATLAACGANTDPALLARVDAVFADYASPDGPGCSVGVIRDGRLVHATGYGTANLDHGIPNGPATIHRIGSVSKQFTAAAIALLGIRCDLDLDAPVRDYISEFPDYSDPPTIRHLVHHTSGVRDYIVLMSLAGNRSEDFYTNQEVLDAINSQRELNFTPGSEFLYSNSGYFLLGEIVARVSGQSLREFAETEFFEPLGMARTHFHDDHNEIVPDRAIGYAPTGDGDGGSEGDGKAFRINVTTLDMVGDGGIFTSVEEWAAWDRNLTDGTVGGPEWVALMHQRGVLNSSDTIPYAFGIAHGEHRGLATVGHGGAWVGYRAGMSRYPETGHSFVALCNRSQIDPMALIASTAEIYLEDRMEPLAEDAEAEAEADAPAETAGEGDAPQDPPGRDIPNRTRYAGSFHSPELNATYRILEEAGAGLALHAGRLEPLTLRAGAEGDGVLVAERGLTLRFSEAAGGRFQSLMVDAGRVRNLRFTRVGDR
ncbi:MAG: serine hydrolase [Gemmatimonadota bacterium]|nr:serine hydrolase [Gemmatimonadota bacterium]